MKQNITFFSKGLHNSSAIQSKRLFANFFSDTKCGWGRIIFLGAQMATGILHSKRHFRKEIVLNAGGPSEPM